METKKDVLCFLNQLKCKEKIDDVLIQDMKCVKRFLVNDIGHFKRTTMVYALNTIDEMFVSITTDKKDDFLEQNNTIGERIY